MTIGHDCRLVRRHEATRAEKGRLLDEAGAVLALVPPGFDTPCPLPVRVLLTLGELCRPAPSKLQSRS